MCGSHLLQKASLLITQLLSVLKEPFACIRFCFLLSMKDNSGVNIFIYLHLDFVLVWFLENIQNMLFKKKKKKKKNMSFIRRKSIKVAS